MSVLVRGLYAHLVESLLRSKVESSGSLRSVTLHLCVEGVTPEKFIPGFT